MITINEERNFDKANNLFDKLSVNSKPNTGNSVEYTKKLNNRVLGIVKENSEYTIKIAEKKSGQLIAEDFQYINGYEDRKRFQRKTLQEAIKYLHLYLNEDQYVLDVPVPTAPAPTPEPQLPPMDNPQDAPVDGEVPADDTTGAPDGEAASNDDQQEMQKLTGTLAQDLRQEIQSGDENFTVGMFKSILAAAKDLSPDNKEKIMNKAEEVLAPEEGEPQDGQNDTPQQQLPMDNNIQEGKGGGYDFDDLTKVAALTDATPPQEIVNMLTSKFGDLPNCDDYKTMADDKQGAVRFMTTGKYDLIVIYFATVEIENYDVFVVAKNDVSSFLHNIDNFAEAKSYIRNQMIDKDFKDVDLPIRQFLTDPKKPINGNLSVSKMTNESTFTTKKQLFESLGISVKKILNEDEFEDEMDDERRDTPIFMKPDVRPFKKIDWKEVYEVLVHNETALKEKGSRLMALNVGDLEDDHLLNRNEIRLLEEISVVWLQQKAFPVFSEPEIPTYDVFIKEIQQVWDKYLSGEITPNVDTSTADEKRYFGGRE